MSSFFLGFPLDSSLEKLLEKANPALVALFTQGGDYLAVLERKEMRYVGKKISFPITFPELELIHLHILSLVRRLAPAYNLSPLSLVLLIDPPYGK